MEDRKLLLPLFLAFAAILLTGLYRAFFVLFLKNQLGWSQDQILVFVTLVSAVLVPLSWKLIKIIGEQKSRTNIIQGSFIKAMVTIALGLGVRFLSFTSLFILEIIKGISGLMVASGKSGFLTRRFRRFPEEIGAIDTIFTPLGVAFGSLMAGFLLKFFGFSIIFQCSGFLLLLLTLCTWLLLRRN